MRLTRKIGLQQMNLAPSLFKPEFVGPRGVWQWAAKRFLFQDQNKVGTIGENKYSCKGVSEKNNGLYFECYNHFEVFD